jgi:hypothetical protein
MADGKKKAHKAGGKKLLFIRPETYEALRAAAEGGGLVPDPTQFDVQERAGRKHFRLRPTATGDDGRSGRARSWVPTVRGNTLTVGRGAIMLVEVRKRTQDEAAPPPRAVSPIFPTFEGTPIFPGPAEKNITGMSGGSLWLIMRSDYCQSAVGGDADPERVELVAKDAAPDIESGEVRILLSKFDLEAAGSGLAIKDPIYYWLSDVVWPFSCEAEGDDDDSDDPSLDDTDPDGSGSQPPAPAPSSAPSDPDPDPPFETCPVTIDANWANQEECFNKSPFGTRKVLVDITVSITLGGDLCTMCPNWWADAWLQKGTPVNPGSANVQPDKSIRWPIGCGDVRTISFEVDPFVPCETLFFRARVKSSPPVDPSESGPCCDHIFSQDFIVKMPPYCGESCSTVV